MRRFICALFVAFALPVLGHADIIRYFGLTESFYSGRSIDFGTIGIDTTTGVFYLNGSFGQPPLFPPYLQILAIDDDSFKGFYAVVTRDYIPFSLYLPVMSLVDYAGGPICSAPQPCENLAAFAPHQVISEYGETADVGYVESGSLTPVSATPEPSTFLLLATGTIVMYAIGYQRNRGKSAHAHTLIPADAPLSH